MNRGKAKAQIPRPSATWLESNPAARAWRDLGEAIPSRRAVRRRWWSRTRPRPRRSRNHDALRDRPARAGSARNCFPSLPLEDDVRKVEKIPSNVDLSVGGFPCQDLSQAGKTAGIEEANPGRKTVA